MERRVARAEDLPPLQLRRVRTLELEEPSSPGGTPHVAAASGVVRRAEYVYVIADDELDLAVFDASSDAPGRLVPALSGELPSDHEARSKAKPDLEALTSLPPFEGRPHGALLGLGSGSTTDRDRGFAWALAADGSLDGEPIELDLAPLYSLLRERLDALNVEGHEALLVEDTAKNLAPARALGMTTILIAEPGADNAALADYVVPDVLAAIRVALDLEQQSN